MVGVLHMIDKSVRILVEKRFNLGMGVLSGTTATNLVAFHSFRRGACDASAAWMDHLGLNILCSDF